MAMKHRISLSPKGRLIFHDHTEDDFVLWALSDYKSDCGCAEFLQDWRILYSSRLEDVLHGKGTGELRKAMNDARYKHNIRQRSKPVEQWLRTQLENKIVAKIKAIIVEKFEATNYRRPSSKWGGGNVRIVVYSVSENRSDIVGYSREKYIKNKEYPVNDLEVAIRLSPTWYSKVYKRGLAVVHKMLVVRAVELPAGGYLIQAGRQGRGLLINSRWYRYEPASNKIREATEADLVNNGVAG